MWIIIQFDAIFPRNALKSLFYDHQNITKNRPNTGVQLMIVILGRLLDFMSIYWGFK